jgi:hypothetical protein
VPTKDYQLTQALNHLKGLPVITSTPKPAEKTAAAKPEKK